MTFLQPLLLVSLPLVGIPILIHLINRQRHRTIPWGAMMFLLDAKRLQRGMAKLRFWLIMAMRMLAIAGLIFAASRPFSSGWLGSTVGTQADTTLLLLDRSPSMEQQDPLTRRSKRDTAIEKLAEFLETTARGRRTVLIENTRYQAEEIDVSQLRLLPDVTATATTADIPRMVQVALDHIVDNEIGQADIWIASDLRRNDWQAEDGRWAALRQEFAQREGIRFHLLMYTQPNADNLAVSVRNVRKRQFGNANELVLDVVVMREGVEKPPQTVAIEFLVNGARSVLEIEMEKDEFVLQGHVIPIDGAVELGWGRVAVPGDSNPADNAYYFVFADEPVRRTTIVSDHETSSQPIEIAARRGPDLALQFDTAVMPRSLVGELDWEQSSLIVWHAQLPEGVVAEQMQAFLASGRPVIFFPPDSPNANAFAGVRWGQWQTSQDTTPVGIASMVSDSDLLARTQSGSALPLSKLRTFRYCQMDGPGKPLARLTTGDNLLLRVSEELPAYFFATNPQAEYSSLARDGVVLYVMVQRAIAMGAEKQGDARNVEAGSSLLAEAERWSPLTELPEGVVSSARPYHAAAYRSHEDTLYSINRSTAEDGAGVISDEALSGMLSGLDYHKISDDLGEGSPLANEIWRVFLALMAVALISEAALCLS